MNPFAYKGKSVEFEAVTGEVLGSNKYAETRVHATGGGGYMHDGSGQISAPTITSTVTTKHEFWVKSESGQEVPVKLSGIDVPLRPGQKVTMISARRKGKGKDNSYWVLLVNHDANRWWRLLSPEVFFTTYKLARTWTFHTYMAIAIYIGIYYMFPHAKYGGGMLPLHGLDPVKTLKLSAIVCGAYFILGLAYHKFKLYRLKAAIRKHLDNIANNALQPGGPAH